MGLLHEEATEDFVVPVPLLRLAQQHRLDARSTHWRPYARASVRHVSDTRVCDSKSTTTRARVCVPDTCLPAIRSMKSVWRSFCSSGVGGWVNSDALANSFRTSLFSVRTWADHAVS